MFDDFQQALEGAANIQEKGQYADIDKAFESTFQQPVVNAVGAGVQDRAQVANDNVEAQARAELDKLKERIQAERDKADPTKYQKVVNVNDGGYDFYDPEGNKISPIDYARVTGKPILDVMDKSGRQSDEDFRLDYEAMIDLNSAVQTGTVDDFFERYDNLAPIRSQLEKMTNEDLMGLLAQQHPSAFGIEEDLPTPVGSGQAGENMLQSVIDRILPGSQFGNTQDYDFPGFSAELVKRGNRYN